MSCALALDTKYFERSNVAHPVTVTRASTKTQPHGSNPQSVHYVGPTREAGPEEPETLAAALFQGNVRGGKGVVQSCAVSCGEQTVRER